MSAIAELREEIMPNKEEKEPYRGLHRDSGWTWLTIDGSKLEVGSWYKSKRGFILKIVDIAPKQHNKFDKREYAHSISHGTGNIVFVDEEQVSWFTLTEDPGTPCGTMLVGDQKTDEHTPAKKQELIKYDDIYSKYPHVVPGSIYKVQNISQEKAPSWERKRKGQKLSIKGQVRCKIICGKCKGERDIKVQDAFQVKLCLDCRGKKRKTELNKFLAKKPKTKKAKASK